MDIPTFSLVTTVWIAVAASLALLSFFFLSVGHYALRRPSEAALRQVLPGAGRGRANHKYVGGTRSTSGHPLGKSLNFWQIDFDRVQVGEGEQAYKKGVELLASLGQMQLRWSSATNKEAKKGAAVILTTRVLGVAYVLTPMRITYAVESSGDHHIPGSDAAKEIRQLPCFAKGKRFDLALSSLQGSALSIEERFSMQWCQEDGTVWYELYSISKPATLDAYLAYPLLRYYQRRFRDSSVAVVKRALAPDEAMDAAMKMRDTMKMG